MARFAAGALFYCAGLVVAPLAAVAAEMSYEPAKPNAWIFADTAFVAIDGEIQSDDGRRFEQIEQKITRDHPKYVIVGLSGPGGNLIAGLRIGTTIHEHGWATAVGDDKTCDSVCGYIWIAGAPRIVSKTSHIGFHAAYNAATQRETGPGNAVLGGYLTNMGLSYDAIAYLTTPGPAQMTYLSAEAAAKYGIATDGELPSEADLAPPQTMRKVVGRPYVDRYGNYVIPADIVPYIGVDLETMVASPPNYETGLKTLQFVFRGASPVTTAPDGSVIIPADAILTHFPHCDRACSYKSMDIWMRLSLDKIHQIENGAIPPQQPNTAYNGPPPCSAERLRLARRFQSLGVEYQLRAMELCPFEMCPYLGPRLMEIGPTRWGMTVARLCPQL
jgi:hypothetical protein